MIMIANAKPFDTFPMCTCVYVCIYIYMYIVRERERSSIYIIMALILIMANAKPFDAVPMKLGSASALSSERTWSLEKEYTSLDAASLALAVVATLFC